MESTHYRVYWIIYPVKHTDINISSFSWGACTTKEVLEGRSPLKSEGEALARVAIIHTVASLNDLWLFPNINFASVDSLADYSKIFPKVIKSLTGCMISNEGIITIGKDFHFNGTATPFPFQSHPSIHISNETLGNAIALTNSIIELKAEDKQNYSAIYDYIVDIRNSPVFISELAMWSFIENRWAYGKKTTSHQSSLSNLLKLVYPEAKDRAQRKSLDKKIKKIGISLGKEYDESHLINMLAHGKHMPLQEGWTDEQWDLFFSVHSDLLNLILKGLEVEINNLIHPHLE